MKKNLIHIITILLLVSCTGKKSVQGINSTSIEHASLLKIEHIEDGLTICRIANPWKQDETIVQYLLLSNNKELNSKEREKLEVLYGKSTVIKTPLEHITLTASCHAYLLNQIDAIGNVAAMSDAEYVAYAPVKEMIADKKIAEAGSSMAPNIESILSVNSDAVWISPFENTNAGNLETLPIPIIYCADYMETSPLGRAEWMKFYGLLVDKELLADSLFNVVKTNYRANVSAILPDSIEQNKNNKLSPILLAEIPYQATWYIPGGCSTMGILYQDAGFSYPWADDNHSGSLNLSTEIVFNKAHDADIWIFKYLDEKDLDMNDFIAQNHFFTQFKAAKEGNVFGCNTSTSDFYDVVPFRPDLLIEEMIKIKNGNDGIYFNKLKQ